MKHQCETMKGVSASIKKFNKGVEGITTMIDARLHDAPNSDELDEINGKLKDLIGYGGMIFSILVYGKKDKEKICQGFGMRFLYCPFCGEKIDKK